MKPAEKSIVLLSDSDQPATILRMGRPPLNMKVLNVRLPHEAIEQIDELVGAYKRPQFIREAVERELEHRKKSDQ
jgi:hypothetical protein